MNRNTQSHFANIPQMDIPRSKIRIPYNYKTAFNTGDLIPFFLEQEVYPGDTFKIESSFVVRMATPIYPVMDNAYLDTYFFAVPYRILWEHLKDFMGENRQGIWAQTTEYTIPQISFPSNGWDIGTIADYFGLPTNVKTKETVSALPFRAYVKIFNEFFRDQNLIAPLREDYNDTTIQGNNNVTENGGTPAKVAKFHDYFTSCLPAPQKGDPVKIPIASDSALVWGNDQTIADKLGQSLNQASNVYFIPNATATSTPYPLYSHDGDIESNNYSWASFGPAPAKGGAWNGNYARFIRQSESNNNSMTTGLYVDLSNVFATSINTLREAIAAQRILEKDARNGSRYREIIKGHFNVTSPDARQQIPEYLGGRRIPINMNQAVQTSSTDSTSPQGNTAAFSVTADNNADFVKSFTEHSIIIGLCCIRTDQTYSQGIHRSWSKKRRLDFYWPALAHLGEQAVLNKEIFLENGTSDANDIQNNQTFGFQERWAELRYKPNMVTGNMRPTAQLTLSSWHYAAQFQTLPTLSQNFIEEPKEYLGRTLAVTDEDQFIMDTFLEIHATRPLPLYSVPGLMDHY